MQHLRWIVACAALYFAHFQVHAETFFGIEIGGPFAIRECTDDDLVHGKNADKGFCIRSNGVAVTQHPWGAITHQVEKPFGMQSPSWGFKTYGFSVKEYQGRVVEVAVATYGAQWQREALADLTEKFGKPGTVKKSILQNAFGVKVEKVSASWKKPGFAVQFEGVGESEDIGFITITAGAAAGERRAAEEWRQANLPKAKM